MWSSTAQTGGGFMNTSLSSPSGGGGAPAGGKAKRAQNVVPVLIDEVLKAPEEGFSIEGTEVGMIKVMGRVVNVEKSATKTSYQIEDGSGAIECVKWVEEGQDEAEIPEGEFVKVVGTIRVHGEKKNVMTIVLSQVHSEEEKDFHALEVAYSHLKLRQLNERMSGGMMGGGGGNAGLSNSMMGGGSTFGGGGAAAGGNSFAAANSFGNKNYDLVYGQIKGCKDDSGINVGVLFNDVRNKMSKQEMDNAIDFLSSEGHIYSTVDDEHYRVTDDDY